MLSRAEEKLVRRLGGRKGRDAEGLFIAEGVRVVEELLASGIEGRLAVVSPSLAETERGRRLRERLRERIDVREVGDGELAELSDTRTHQGVLVVAAMPEVELGRVEPSGRATALVLDGVQDPGNLGTLARTAAAFGCELLACLPGTVDPWNPKAVRGSAGALFRYPVVQAGADAVLDWLGGHDFTVLGADTAGTPYAADGGRVALVVGNEGAGLGPEVRARCNGLVAVPMPGGTESLNVAVAGGILLYLISRERG